MSTFCSHNWILKVYRLNEIPGKLFEVVVLGVFVMMQYYTSITLICEECLIFGVSYDSTSEFQSMNLLISY